MTDRERQNQDKAWRRSHSQAEAIDADERELHRREIIETDDLPRLLRRFGITRAAMEKAGIDSTAVSRLQSGENVETVSETTRQRLLSAASTDQRDAFTNALDQCLMSPVVRSLLEHAGQWRRVRAGLPTKSRPPVPTFAGPNNRLAFVDLDAEALQRERLNDFVAAHRRVAAVLPNHSLALVGDNRVVLAWWRILEPLLDWQESGFTERHWSELSDDEFQRFVEAGLERESILSSRDDDLSRVRGAITMRRPPDRWSPEPLAERLERGTAEQDDSVVTGDDTFADVDDAIGSAGGIDAAIGQLPDKEVQHAAPDREFQVRGLAVPTPRNEPPTEASQRKRRRQVEESTPSLLDFLRADAPALEELYGKTPEEIARELESRDPRPGAHHNFVGRR